MEMDTRDGAWDSNQLATCASRIIEAEETNSALGSSSGTGLGVQRASDIPESARLHDNTTLEHFLSEPVAHELMFIPSKKCMTWERWV